MNHILKAAVICAIIGVVVSAVCAVPAYADFRRRAESSGEKFLLSEVLSASIQAGSSAAGSSFLLYFIGCMVYIRVTMSSPW